VHLIASTPGGCTSDNEGVVFVEQNSAPIIFLSAADTDIQNLAHAINHLPTNFPAIRAVNFL
jgi:cobaltochelatase CobN